jgi:hypothetical protein
MHSRPGIDASRHVYPKDGHGQTSEAPGKHGASGASPRRRLAPVLSLTVAPCFFPVSKQKTRNRAAASRGCLRIAFFAVGSERLSLDRGYHNS